MMPKRTFDVVLEKDEDGWFIADVPAIPGCHTQGKTRAEVLKNIREAIELCLIVQGEEKDAPVSTFVGIERVTVHA